MEEYATDLNSSFDKVGTAVLLLSQMLFTCVGTLMNNLLLVTLKDLPDLSASTYHILLTNLGLANLFVCTVLKPASGIYIAYAYAKNKKTVDLQFCHIYTFLRWTFLPILPWSIFALAWQIFLSSRRKTISQQQDTPKSSNNEDQILSKIESYHKASRKRNPSQRRTGTRGIERPIHPQNNHKRHASIETDVEKWLRNKAMTMDEGPRPGQILVLLIIWAEALTFGVERLDSQPEVGTEVKEIFVEVRSNTSKLKRYEV